MCDGSGLVPWGADASYASLQARNPVALPDHLERSEKLMTPRASSPARGNPEHIGDVPESCPNVTWKDLERARLIWSLSIKA
jgi:hypothetical protein